MYKQVNKTTITLPGFLQKHTKIKVKGRTRALIFYVNVPYEDNFLAAQLNSLDPSKPAAFVMKEGKILASSGLQSLHEKQSIYQSFSFLMQFVSAGMCLR